MLNATDFVQMDHIITIYILTNMFIDNYGKEFNVDDKGFSCQSHIVGFQINDFDTEKMFYVI